MLRQLNDSIKRLEATPALTNVYGAARSAMALITAGILFFNAPEILFTATKPIMQGGGPAFPWNLFVLVPDLHLARLIGIVLLLVVASGWRPRLTGLIHAWIALSLSHTPAVIDGGEHVSQVFAMLMLPLTLFDGRKWHWQPPQSTPIANVAGNVLFVGIRLQACLIYLEAATAKLGVPEWRDGTALYYWASDTTMGAGPWVRATIDPLFHSPLVVMLATWSVIVLELALAAMLFAAPEWRRRLLVLGIAFHAAIIPMHGITSFALMMMAVLVLYLRAPADLFVLPVRLPAHPA